MPGLHFPSHRATRISTDTARRGPRFATASARGRSLGRRSPAGLAVVAASLAGVATLGAQSAPSVVKRDARDTTRIRALDTLKVVGRIDDLIGIASSASEGRVGAVDLRSRPLSREGELLETVPGFVATQHSGEGKANQYFVRGFNLDHGTDFQTRVEGMPVNMASHAHGQGYTDLNFLIPELVDHLSYKLGVHHADIGDFGSAGGAEFRLAKRLDRPLVALGGGAFGMARAVLAGSQRVGTGDLLVGGEVKRYDGPWDLAEGIRKYSGLARYSWDRGASRFSLLGLAYQNRWNSTDQIPQRAVDGALISRLGQIDNSDGGETQRYSLSGSWKRVGERSAQEVQLFGIYSDLSLFSNFSFFLEDPVRGDQFNQRERRTIIGANAKHLQMLRAFGIDHAVTVGLQSRGDIIDDLGLHRTQRQQRFGTVRQDDVREWGTGLFAQAESRWQPWLRSVIGLRGDAYAFDVSSNLTENSGTRGAAIASPKASLIFAPSAGTEVYVSGGFGFHSNDARGTTITVDPATGDEASRVDPLVRSRGGEVGLRLTPLTGWRSTLSVWALNLDSELLFIGDGGATEASAASRRAGVTFANFYRPIPQLALDADVSFARARLSGVPSDENHVPGALENVVAAGVTFTPASRGFLGALRLRHFGSYPLIEDNSVRATSTTLVNAEARWRLPGGVQLQAMLLNLTNSRANDIQYFYASRLGDEPADGVEDVHFHPIEPRQLRVGLVWGF